MQKISEMMIAVAGNLLQQVDSVDEMQARLEIVKQAWNISLYPEKEQKKELEKFFDAKKPYAPNPEALLALQWEFKRIIKQKEKLYPTVNNKISIAEAIEVGKNDYIIRAYFDN